MCLRRIFWTYRIYPGGSERQVTRIALSDLSSSAQVQAPYRLSLTFSPLHLYTRRSFAAVTERLTRNDGPCGFEFQVGSDDHNNESIFRGQSKHDSSATIDTYSGKQHFSTVSSLVNSGNGAILTKIQIFRGSREIEWPNTSTAKELGFGFPTRSKAGYRQKLPR